MKRFSSSRCPFFRELTLVEVSIYNGYELHLGASYNTVAF
jgi:hypothetical protein